MDPDACPATDAVWEAMATLGVTADDTWDDVRRAYRSLVRDVHPDVADHASATSRTAALNVAFDVLLSATDEGRLALPEPPPPPPPPPPRDTQLVHPPVVIRARPGDVFVQILDAAHRLGDVSYVDPEAGLIQVLLERGDPAASQLLIDIDQQSDPPRASFTLDSMDAEEAEPIAEIVDRLASFLDR